MRLAERRGQRVERTGATQRSEQPRTSGRRCKSAHQAATFSSRMAHRCTHPPGRSTLGPTSLSGTAYRTHARRTRPRTRTSPRPACARSTCWRSGSRRAALAESIRAGCRRGSWHRARAHPRAPAAAFLPRPRSARCRRGCRANQLRVQPAAGTVGDAGATLPLAVQLETWHGTPSDKSAACTRHRPRARAACVKYICLFLSFFLFVEYK